MVLKTVIVNTLRDPLGPDLGRVTPTVYHSFNGGL